jgi:hypothetical protein
MGFLEGADLLHLGNGVGGIGGGGLEQKQFD